MTFTSALFSERQRLKLLNPVVIVKRLYQGILKGGSITVPLTSCLTGLETAV